jgi:hypothetical protein
MVGMITLTSAPAPAGRAPLTGVPDQIIMGLQRYADAGLQHLIADVRADGDPSLAETLAALQTIANQVLPTVQKTSSP